MKTVPQVVLTVVVSVLAAAIAATLLVPRVAQPADADAAGAIARVQATLQEVQHEQRALRDALENLALRVNAAAPAHSALPLEDIDAAVARAVEQRLGQHAAAKPAIAEPAAAESGELDVADSIATLLDPDLSETARQELWEELREAGLLDEVVAAFEARVKANPNDPALHVDLAKAYLQKIFEVGSGPMAGVWADKADDAFDAALALDDHQWDARFSKAVSLSFWPPIFGKQAEAISQFETLVAQQQAQPQQPQFAQTYLWLGNLYQQQGKTEQALAAWKQGLSLFPNDASLQGKLNGT